MSEKKKESRNWQDLKFNKINGEHFTSGLGLVVQKPIKANPRSKINEMKNTLWLAVV